MKFELKPFNSKIHFKSIERLLKHSSLNKTDFKIIFPVQNLYILGDLEPLKCSKIARFPV